MQKSVAFTILASMLITAALVIAGVFIGSTLSGRPGDSAVTAAVPASEIQDSIGSNGSIAIPGFKTMVMKAGKTIQSVNLSNPAKNTCYFRISINLPDGTELFQSGMIKPGQTIKSLEISKPLSKGEYKNAVLKYDCYSLDGEKQLNGAKTLFNLEVV